MTNLRLARGQLEKAIVAFIEKKREGTEYFELSIQARLGELDAQGKFKLANLDEVPLPSVAVAAPILERHPMGYAAGDVHIVVLGSQDGEDATNKHEALVGWIASLFGEDQLATVVAAVSPPSSGTDERKIKNFRMFGLLSRDESSQETDRAFIDDFVYLTHSQPTDDVSL